MKVRSIDDPWPTEPPYGLIGFCFKCDKITEHFHQHDTAHGLAGTHMEGSERFTCIYCGNSVYPEDNNGRFNFVLDTEFVT